VWRLLLILVIACGRDRDGSLTAQVAQLSKRLPGLQITVEYRGDVILDAGYGFADVENQVPVTPDSVFCIGSISKQFGAAAVLQLVEQGKLSLDDTLAKFDPTFPRGERITIRDLLRHTTGIEDFEYTGPWPPVMSVERTQAELIGMFEDRPPRFEPNHGWAYSTSNYVVLGEIIAKVSGQPLAAYMQANVWSRAGLTQTRFCETYELIPHRARGYDTKDGKLVPTALQLLEQFSIGGGICSTTRELLRWQHALESGRVVSAASYQMMITPTPLADGTPTGYGFGLYPGVMAGHRMIGHEGNVSGFTASLTHFVDDDLRVAAITNHRSLSTPWWPVVTKLLEIPPAKPVPIAPAELKRYEHLVTMTWGKLKFVADGDHLALVFIDDEGHASPPAPMTHVGDDTFETEDHFVRMHFMPEWVEYAMYGMRMYLRY
jgi:CubicO group peptidase (beta-lactamase class C family)